jgi:hypothetical protein
MLQGTHKAMGHEHTKAGTIPNLGDYAAASCGTSELAIPGYQCSNKGCLEIVVQHLGANLEQEMRPSSSSAFVAV